MDENSSVSNRSTLDVCHFALFAAGFFIGSAGVVIACPAVALTGAFFIFWSILYFLVAG